MDRTTPFIPVLLLAGTLMASAGCGQEPPTPGATPGADPGSTPGEEIRLPAPRLQGPRSLEEVVHGRRSIRAFRPDPLDPGTLGQLLWSAQGITDPAGLRAGPSAGGLFPLEILVVAGAVDGLEPGVYRYRPHAHSLVREGEGERRSAVAQASLGQGWMAEAPVLLVVAAEMARTAGRYGDRAPRYVHMEVGHAAQNVYLQAEALGLGTTVVGAFRDQDLARVVGLRQGEVPLAVLPVGRPR